MLDRAGLEDLEDLEKLEAICFRNPWTYKELYAEMMDNPFSNIYFYRLEDGTIAGYIIVWKIFEQASISRVAILPEHRRKGYGKDLLGLLMKGLAAEGLETISLEVRTSNESALRLYESLGFERLTCIKGYYEDGEDAWRMFRVLIGQEE